MYQLIFVCSVSKLLDRNELNSIANEKLRNTKEDGITGILLYKDGSYFGVYEGEEEDVKRHYRNACKNCFGKDVLIIDEGNIETRQFDYWSVNWLDNGVSKLFSDEQIRRDRNGSMSMLNEFVRNSR